MSRRPSPYVRDTFSLERQGAPARDLFTDIRLCGKLSGRDVGEGARANRPGIPVIYASGYSIAPPRAVAGSLFFNKPYDPAEIMKACRSLAEAR